MTAFADNENKQHKQSKIIVFSPIKYFCLIEYAQLLLGENYYRKKSNLIILICIPKKIEHKIDR